MSVRRWLSEHWDEVQKIARVIAEGKEPDSSELAQEVAVVMLEKEETLDRLVERGVVKYWVVRVCLNNYRSSTSRFHYKFRRRMPDAAVEHWKHVTTDTQEKELMERQLSFIEREARGLDEYERMIFRVYWEEGHSLNSMAEATGIKRSSIYKALSKAHDEINKAYMESGGRGGLAVREEWDSLGGQED